MSDGTTKIAAELEFGLPFNTDNLSKVNPCHLQRANWRL